MNDALGRYLRRKRVRAVLPHVRGRLLDIGCGANDLVHAYAGEGTGVDVHQWGRVDVVAEDSSRLPFQARSCDCVTIIAALNHIPNRREVLAEVHRVLTPGGRLIVTMLRPMLSRVWHGLRKPWDADQKERGMAEGEVFGMTPREVRTLLTEAGFRILREERFMLGLNRLTIAEKVDRPATGGTPPEGPGSNPPCPR